MVNWIETYDLGMKLNFLNEKRGITEITSTGKTFYSMSNSFSELSIEQKLFTFKNGILSNSHFKFINNFLKLFSINKENTLEFYNTQDGYTKLRSKDRFILFELSKKKLGFTMFGLSVSSKLSILVLISELHKSSFK